VGGATLRKRSGYNKDRAFLFGGSSAPSGDANPLGLDIAKLFFGQSRLFKDAAKCSFRNVFGMHRDVSLSSVRMAQDDVRS